MIEILNVSPVAGAIDPATPLAFDVRTDDPNTFVRIIVGIYYAGAQMQEFVYAGEPLTETRFLPFYSASSVNEITDAGYQRFRFNLQRASAPGQPMWLDSPLLVVYAFNDAGEEL